MRVATNTRVSVVALAVIALIEVALDVVEVDPLSDSARDDVALVIELAVMSVAVPTPSALARGGRAARGGEPVRRSDALARAK